MQYIGIGIKLAAKLALDILLGACLGIVAVVAVLVAGTAFTAAVAILAVAAVIFFGIATVGIAIFMGGAFVVGYPVSSGRVVKQAILALSRGKANPT